MLTPLANLIDSAGFHSLSVVRSGDQWQANLQVVPGNSFRIRQAATPSEAIVELFAPAPGAPPSPPPLPH